MIGKKISHLIKSIKLRTMRKKIRLWHRLYKKPTLSAAEYKCATSRWMVCNIDKEDAYDEIGALEAYSLSPACLNKLIEIMSTHPSAATNEVSAHVDEHVYSMV